MDIKIEKKGMEKSTKQIALFNEAKTKENNAKVECEKIVNKLDSIAKIYDKFAKENR